MPLIGVCQLEITALPQGVLWGTPLLAMTDHSGLPRVPYALQQSRDGRLRWTDEADGAQDDTLASTHRCSLILRKRAAAGGRCPSPRPTRSYRCGSSIWRPSLDAWVPDGSMASPCHRHGRLSTRVTKNRLQLLHQTIDAGRLIVIEVVSIAADLGAAYFERIGILGVGRLDPCPAAPEYPLLF